MAQYIVNEEDLVQIADAIRERQGGITRQLTFPGDFTFQINMLYKYDATAMVDKTIGSMVDRRITTVGEYAFYKCTSLGRVEFSKVTSIGNYAFYGCTNLDEIVILNPSKVCSLGSNALTGTRIANGNGRIMVPSSLLSQYKSAANWKNYANYIVGI